MGRLYTASYAGISVSSGLQNLITVEAPSTASLRIVSAGAGQESDAGETDMELIRLGFYSYDVAGFGGVTITAHPHHVGHGAFAGSARRNETTVGSRVGVEEWAFLAWNDQFTWRHRPLPEDSFWIPPTEIFSIRLQGNTGPADPITFGAWITFEVID